MDWNACATSAGASCGFSIRAAHLVRVFRMPIWSGISCSIPWPLPMNRLGICPHSASTGALVDCAVASAAVALSSPGPGTTENTCGLPVASAAPSAM